MKQRTAMVLAAFMLIVTTAAVASGITYMTLDGRRYADGDMVMISAEDYARYSQYTRLQEVKDIIDREYFLEPDGDALFEGAARGMLASLGDPYSFYYSPDQMLAFYDHADGSEYVGIGIQMRIDPDDGLIIVTRVFKGSSALAAGILPGDKIIGVFGEDVRGLDMDAVRDRVVGEAGTEAQITILRDGQELDFTLERVQVVINRTEHRMVTDTVGLITLYEFMGDDVKGFDAAISELKKQGMKALILDIRGNPGGFVSDVVPITDRLVPEGLVMYTEDRYGNRVEQPSTRGYLDIPLVVLVNELSASASEILAGAVQDHEVGTVVGETTFGKGIVQTVHTFPSDGAGLQLTVSKYYTPNGRSIHEIGITPDVEVIMPEELKTKAVLEDAEDVQLQKGIEILEQALNADE